MTDAYTRGQKIYHWLLAVLILFWLFVSGELVEDAEGADKGFLLMFHSGGALVILLLTLFRYRLRRRNPVAPMADLKIWEKVWSVRVHLTLYLLLCLMVLSGLLQGMFFEQPVRIFGLLNVTVGHNEALQELFHTVHGTTANLLKILIGIHILAALKNQFVDRKAALRRML